MIVKVLLVGNMFDNHIRRFIKNLDKINNDDKILVDIFSIEYNQSTFPEESKYFEEIFLIKKHLPNVLYNKLSIKFFYIIDLFSTIKEIKKKYDIINIHYLTFISFYLWNIYRKLGDKLVLTPWGSDVLKTKYFRRKLISFCFRKADYITIDDSETFNNSLKYNFKIDNKRLVKTGFGSDIIDLISNQNKNLSPFDAKKKLGYPGKFIITCGYNANPAQNHKEIINAINNIKEKLPSNLLLFFPLTYGCSDSYNKKLSMVLSKYDLDYVFFENYLSNNEMILLQKATDIFIHVQKSDGFSASLQEFLLSGAKVINGKWLHYPTLEQFGKPFHEIETIEMLQDGILEAVNHHLLFPEKLYNYLIQQGWKTKIQLWKDFYLSLKTDDFEESNSKKT